MTRTIASRAAFLLCLLSAGLGSTPLLADCDTTAPALTAFSFSPSAIDTTLAPRTVTCNMTLTDALSGVATASCDFTSPDFFTGVGCDLVAPTSGTRQNGTWSCVVTFPRYEKSGVWTASVTATDAVGNTASIDPSTQAFPSMETVTSDPDTIAPALTTFGLVPGAVTVSAAAQNVTCNITATDAKSGISVAGCYLVAPDSSQFGACQAIAPTSGTRNNGVFSCVVSIPRYADAGTWGSQVILLDQIGNIASIAPAPPVNLTVTSVPEDIVEPSQSGFDFNPKTISVGSSGKPVLCTMDVADSPAGVASATCALSISGFVPPADFFDQQQQCTATAPTSGTRNSGTFQCTVNMPRYAAGGVWFANATLTDTVGNSTSFSELPTLTVDCVAGDAETTCRFAANKTSLTWDVAAGATQYNVYRGPQTNLVDANADHLPDGGFGTCQNSRDANLTDTTFVDTDIPSVAQKGFFYLVSYKTGGVEKGLGMNSFGTPRTVSTPCP